MKNKKTKFAFEIIKSFTLFIALTGSILLFVLPAFADSSGPFEGVLTPISQQVQLPGFETAGHAQSSYESGAGNITSAILFSVDLVKYLMGTIAVLIIIFSGVRLITAAPAKIDEIAPKMKQNLKYAIIGLVVIMMADVMVKRVF